METKPAKNCIRCGVELTVENAGHMAFSLCATCAPKRVSMDVLKREPMEDGKTRTLLIPSKPAPLEFRAFDTGGSGMHYWEHEAYQIAEWIAAETPRIKILQWTGMLDDKKAKIFVDDICHFEVGTEFGSRVKYMVRMIFEPTQAAFIFDTNGKEFTPSEVKSIIRMGSIWEHPELVYQGARPNDNQS